MFQSVSQYKIILDLVTLLHVNLTFLGLIADLGANENTWKTKLNTQDPMTRSVSNIWDSLTNNEFGDAVVGAIALTAVLWLITDITVLLLNHRVRGQKQKYSGLSRVLLFSGVSGRFRWSHAKKKVLLNGERYHKRNKISRGFAKGAAVVVAILEAGFIFLSAPLTRNVIQDSVVGSEVFARVNPEKAYRVVVPEPCSIDEYVETRTGGQSAKLVTCLSLNVQPQVEDPQLNGTFRVRVLAANEFAIASVRTRNFDYQFAMVVYVLQPDGKRRFKSFGTGPFVNGSTLNEQFDLTRDGTLPIYIPRPAEEINGSYLFGFGAKAEDAPPNTDLEVYAAGRVQATLRVMIAERDGEQGHFSGNGQTFVPTDEALLIGQITRPIVPTLAALILLAGTLLVWVIVALIYVSPESVADPIKETLGRLCCDSLGTGKDQIIERKLSWNPNTGVAHVGWRVPDNYQLEGVEEATVVRNSQAAWRNAPLLEDDP